MWRRACRAIASLVLLSAACSNQDAANVASAAPERTAVRADDNAVKALLPLRIVPGEVPSPDAQLFLRAKSVALVAREAIPFIAQARYCWPSFRIAGSVDPFDQRLADLALRNAGVSLPPRCTPEPPEVTALVARSRGSDSSPVAPPTAMQSFLGAIGYVNVGAEGCNGTNRSEGRELRRRWRSDVRIQHTGNAVVDGAFATILADPRFRSAMGEIKVALVTERPNVLIAPHLLDVCFEPGRPCDAQRQPTNCARPGNQAQEVLARRASGGRAGYFPDANEFLRDRTIGIGLEGFTIGDERAIIGAVCLGLAYPYQGAPPPSLIVPEQAAAAACLLRTLGIAGEQAPMDPFSSHLRAQIIRLVDADGKGASLSADAFAILTSLYQENRGRSSYGTE